MKCFVHLAVLAAMQFSVLPKGWAAEDAVIITEAEAVAAFERGKGLLEAGRPDKAIIPLNLGTRSEEKGVLARANLARAYAARIRCGEAADIANEALRLANARIEEAVGNDKQMAQRYVDRGFAWIASLEVHQEALAAEGAAYHGKSVLEAAAEDFERAVNLDSKCFHAYRLLAWTRLQLGNYRESIQACDAAIALQPKCLDVYSTKARSCLRAGGKGEFNEPINRQSDSEGAFLGWKEALATCDEALQIEPRNPRFLLLRASAYCEGELYEKAVAECSQVISMDPDNAIAYLCRAQVRADQGGLVPALEDIDRAAHCKPWSLASPQWLVAILNRQDDLKSIPEEEAMTLVNRICAAATGVGEVYLLRSIINSAYEHPETTADDWAEAHKVGLSPATLRRFPK